MENVKIMLVLASKMLSLAEDEFSNHGCNDLSEEIRKMIPDSMLKDMCQWNSKGKDDWPEKASQVGDSSLMHYLSDKLMQMSTTIDRDIKINDVLSNK